MTLDSGHRRPKTAAVKRKQCSLLGLTLGPWLPPPGEGGHPWRVWWVALAILEVLMDSVGEW